MRGKLNDHKEDIANNRFQKPLKILRRLIYFTNPPLKDRVYYTML